MVKFSTPSEELQNMIRFHHSRPHDRYPCAIRVKSSHGAGETIPLASGYIVKFRDQTVYYHEAGGLCRRLNDKERRKLANQYHEIHWSLGTSSAVVGNGANDKRYQEEVFKNFWQKIEMDGNGAIFEFEMLHNYVDVFYGFFLPADMYIRFQLFRFFRFVNLHIIMIFGTSFF